MKSTVSRTHSPEGVRSELGSTVPGPGALRGRSFWMGEAGFRPDAGQREAARKTLSETSLSRQIVDELAFVRFLGDGAQ